MSKLDSSQVPEFDAESPGYDADICAWSAEQGRRLRMVRIPGLDTDNIAEEIESLGRSDRRELRSRILVLLVHLLKWQVQPDLAGRSWRSTITVQRQHIANLLEESPSLRATTVGVIEGEYPRAIVVAAAETGLFADCFPAGCPWSVPEVLSEAFFPAG